MRINVYSQELTKQVEIVRAVAKDTGIAYAGVRIYLASPDVLHHTPEDDDRSAITFWIPHAESFTQDDLAKIFEKMASLVRSEPPPTPAKRDDNKQSETTANNPLQRAIAIVKQLEQAADRGTIHLQAAWRALTKRQAICVQHLLPELKERAADTDKGATAANAYEEGGD